MLGRANRIDEDRRVNDEKNRTLAHGRVRVFARLDSSAGGIAGEDENRAKKEKLNSDESELSE